MVEVELVRGTTSDTSAIVPGPDQKLYVVRDSPSGIHASLQTFDRLEVRDLGSRNGTWVFLEAPHRLTDGDLILIGSQVLRFRRLGYPGPYASETDATKRMGSVTPSADIASLTQLRGDGSARKLLKETGVALAPGDRLTFRTAGGGGWGEPRQRERAAIERDIAAGYVSPEAARRDYGHAPPPASAAE